MIAIGEFSKICCVTTKTLRYYDEIGLISPIFINKENGYRYYSVSQVETMLKINKLKSYELSLDEIGEIVQSGSDELLIKKMSEQRAVLENKIDGYSNLISGITNDIDNLKKGVSIMSYLNDIEVKLTETSQMNIAFIRKDMPISEFGKNMNELFARVAKENLTVVGAPMAVYHDKEFDPAGSDVEVAIPVAEPVRGTRDLKGGLCATLHLEGPYSELPGCYAKLVEWIDTEGYEIAAPPYERYLTRPEEDPEKHITDIFFPVKKK